MLFVCHTTQNKVYLILSYLILSYLIRRHASVKDTETSPVRTATLVPNSGNTAKGVESIK